MRLTLDSPITPAGSLPDLMPLGHLLPPRLQAPTFVFYGTPPYSSALRYHTIAASIHSAPEKATQDGVVLSQSGNGKVSFLPTVLTPASGMA